MAVSLLALVGATAVAPAQAADLGGKASSNQNEDEFGFRAPADFNWSGIYVGGHLGGVWNDVEWSGPAVTEFVEGGRVSGREEEQANAPLRSADRLNARCGQPYAP